MKLRAAYAANVGSKSGWQREIAKMLGRHPANVVRKAKALGLETSRTRRKRGPAKPSAWSLLTEEQRSAIHSERMRNVWRRFPHPKGMLGKHHSEAVCRKLSEGKLGKPRPPFTDDHRMKISIAMAKRLGLNPESFSRKLNRGVAGKRDDLGGQYFRSRYEANYARFLNFTKQRWEYEKKTFWFLKIKRGVRSYTPDFYLPETNEYHEVKGWMDKKSATKIKRMAKYYPTVKLIIIDGKWFQNANRQGLCRIIPGWECEHKRHAGVPVTLEGM